LFDLGPPTSLFRLDGFRGFQVCSDAKVWKAKDLDWLGGLDSNQDSQIQSLESYQLDDLPTGENRRKWQLNAKNHNRTPSFLE
jgi:hypothetical protein